jgi:Fuc2NAc and GlcNAc transferase
MSTDTEVTAATCLITFAIGAVIARIATGWKILDYPTSRSSHSRPVPRGGGIAIVIAFTTALIVLTTLRVIDYLICLTLGGGGLLIALVGALDDRNALPVRVRIVTHFATAAWAVYVLGAAAPVYLAGVPLNSGIAGVALTIISLVWVLNLFNFMDGIDGLAASEAAFVACGGGVIATIEHTGSAAGAFALAAASLGFLVWNWQPARIFMGDTGSGYLGYSIGVLALDAGHPRAEQLLVWLILGGVFFVDATVTVLRRLVSGEKVHEAHRTHAYQWLARRWKSHQRVTLVVLMVNTCWLLPCALLAARFPKQAVLITLVALTPLVSVALAAGAGRGERSLPNRVGTTNDSQAAAKSISYRG